MLGGAERFGDGFRDVRTRRRRDYGAASTRLIRRGFVRRSVARLWTIAALSATATASAPAASAFATFVTFGMRARGGRCLRQSGVAGLGSLACDRRCLLRRFRRSRWTLRVALLVTPALAYLVLPRFAGSVVATIATLVGTARALFSALVVAASGLRSLLRSAWRAVATATAVATTFTAALVAALASIPTLVATVTAVAASLAAATTVA